VNHFKWLGQAEQDVAAAAALKAAGHHEWACFVALQAAEKAQKAYFYALGMEPPFRQGRDGHDLIKLSGAWPESVRAALPALAQAQTRLNQHAEKTRYPQAGTAGPVLAPHEDYRLDDSEQAIEDARAIVNVCKTLADEAHQFASGLGSVLPSGPVETDL
jgi:HEPN domain-containing protein